MKTKLIVVNLKCILLITIKFNLLSAAATTKTSVLGTCDNPGWNSNSLSNLTDGSEAYPGTVVTYACDGGYQMLDSQNENRVCQHNGTWSKAAPTCVQMVSFGKPINCTTDTCQSSIPNVLAYMVDKNDATCYRVISNSKNDVSRWRLDLLQDFDIRVLRLVIREPFAQITNPNIVMENDNNAQWTLRSDECRVTKDMLLQQQEGSYALTIQPNRPHRARFINIEIKQAIADEELFMCEIQVFAENVPSVEQCFKPGFQESSAVESSAGKAIRHTIIYKGTCYTLDNKNSQEWSLQREYCNQTYGGDLINDVTDDVNQFLISYATAVGESNIYWMGGYVVRNLNPNIKGPQQQLQAVWINEKRIPGFSANNIAPATCLSFNAPRGVWHFFPCFHRTGALCQNGVKRCGSPQISEHVKISPHVWKTDIGVSIKHQCPSGYTMEGDITRVCQASGQWSGVAPTCINDNLMKEKYTMTNGAIIGIVVGVIVGLIIIVVVLVLILRLKQSTFRKKLNVHSESIEALDSNNTSSTTKKERGSLNASTAQNYDSLKQ